MMPSLCCEPGWENLPVTRRMSITSTMLRFNSQKSPCAQRIFLHRRHATPPSALATHPLHTIMFGEPRILSTRLVRQKTLLHIDHVVSLLSWTLTIASDGREILRPLLAHCR